MALAITTVVLRSVRDGRLIWRRTALDVPVLALAACVGLQLLVGNRRLVTWALAPPGGSGLTESFPSAPVFIGTVSVTQTFSSLLLFLAYVAVYYVVVQEIRERRHLTALVRILLVCGGVLAFGALIDYLAGEAWVFGWREIAIRRRLVASFVNPDHFATWLAMLACLGGGYFMSGSARAARAVTIREFLSSRELREATIRRWLPLLSMSVMLVALVFTMSRGGIISALVGLLAVVALFRKSGRVRTMLMMVAVAVATALGYSAWIGLGPIVEHVQTAGASITNRIVQYQASLPMLREFPILGVGLGAYKDVYPRYQPLAHDPASVYYPYAHSDLLQFVIETGIIGFAVLVFATCRVWRDLVRAHCIGRGACPVGGGEGERARRGDPYGVPIAFGALGGVAAAVVHSGVDFSLRIPANGFLAATLLGIATVVLHTRFGSREDVWLSDVRTVAVPRGLASRALACVACLAAGVFIWHVTRAAVLEGRLADYRAAPTTAHAAAAVAAAGSDARALAARAATRVQAATAIGWRTGTQAEARALLGGAIRDLRGALTTTPTDATYHEQLGSALAARARLEGDVNDGSQAMAHFKRAIALAPEDATLYVSLSRFAATQRPPLWDVAFDASRAAVRRDPRLLEALLDEPAFIGLGDDQWLALVPPLFPERLRLALLLEARSQLIPATRVARAALEVATGKHDQAVGGWALARLLLLRGEIEGALGAIATALAADAANPELYVVYGHALRAHGDPRCLDAYRHAVAAVATVMRREGKLAPFSLADVRLRALVDERVGTSPLKYRAVLASYFGDRGLSEQAIDEWLAIVAENGGDGQARFALASVLDSAGHSERALDQYRQAVALDGRPVYRARFAQRLWDSEQYYQAIAQWIEIRQREPRNLDVRLALARAYVRVGERADALREYQAVLGIDAAHPAARREIEQLGRGGR